MNNKIRVNTIDEIYKGHFQVILDFPKAIDLLKIISPTHKYIWGVEHNEGRTTWSEYDGPLYGMKSNEKKAMARNIEMEFLIEANTFLSIIPDIRQTVKIIQVNNIPPSYMDIKKLKGKNRYDMLKEKTDYLFEIDIPGATDYAPIVSPNLDFLNKIINVFKQ